VDNLPEQRIGDRERRAVDDRLQRATGDGLLTLAEYDERSGQLWQARTRGELEAVTADLPPEPSDALPAVHLSGQPSVDRVKADRSTRLRRHPLRRLLVAGALAVGIAAGGVAVIEHGSDGRAVFGSAVVRAGTRNSVDVGVLFGSVQVIVPDNARVDTAGTVVFGSLECNRACDAGRSGRVVHVHGSGGFGSVQVLTQSEYDADSGR